MTRTSPRAGMTIDGDVCGRLIEDGTVGSVCGKPAVWRIQYNGWSDSEATACDDHVDEARDFKGTVRVYPNVSAELWSQLYDWLGDRTSDPDGDEWDHDKLQRLVRDLIAGPLVDVLAREDDL